MTINKLPILFQDEEMTMRLLNGNWDEYDTDKTHRTLEIHFTGTDPDVKNKWKITKMVFTEFGLRIKFKCGKTFSEWYLPQ